jgi:hypothetical protein
MLKDINKHSITTHLENLHAQGTCVFTFPQV